MIKSIVAKWWAKRNYLKTQKWVQNPIETQEKILKQLVQQAKNTSFGKDHRFDQISDSNTFSQRVPIRDYEGLRPYIDRMVAGDSDVLWPGKPTFFAKTSGTTSGTKWIPLTKASLPFHIQAAREALLNYIYQSGSADFISGKQIFLQGSPELTQKNGVSVGRLSGIVAHFVPSYLQKSRLPSWETNCIDDWETKVDAIVEETLQEDMRLISGIPSWVQMYFERLQAKTGKPISEIFPNFSVFVYGGVNFEPYRAGFEKLMGKKIDSVELFPASEGFIAYQDQLEDKGLLLLLNHGIYYEFIETDKFYEENPVRHTLKTVALGVNYVLILSTNAGLWGYNLGDTIQFTSLHPFRIIVSGRIKHFISAFGEHVIGSEVEQALQTAIKETPETIVINEFTVAPQISPKAGLPYHEWLIEFDTPPKDMNAFRMRIDESMQQKNIYYYDLIVGKVLQPLVIQPIAKDGFTKYMKTVGKLGGQNKVPRLSNDRKIADGLQAYIAR